MKKKLILLGVLLLLFAGIIAFRYFMWDSQNTYGRLKIVSSPSAGIFIDNVAIGKTPYEEKYKVGEYLLKLIPEGDATTTASWQGKVQIYKNSLTYVNRELGATDINSSGEIFTVTAMKSKSEDGNHGEIYVETDPTGAIVYLDNDEKGVAPLELVNVTKGDHELSVFMPGFFRRTQKINIDSGYRVNASFKLAIDQSQRPSPAPQASGSAALTPSKESTSSASSKSSSEKNSITVKETPVGFLRVRQEPTVNASESAQVKPGEKYTILDEKDGWYKINYEQGKEGWVSGQYVTKD